MYVQRNNEARSGNHCCCGKAVSITYFCVCVGGWVLACACARVVLLIQLAMRRHIAPADSLAPPYFFDIIS